MLLSHARRPFLRRIASVFVARCSNESAAKAARLARKAKAVDAKAASSGSLVTPFRVGVLATLGIVGYCSYDIKRNKSGTLGTLYYGSPLESFMVWLYSETIGRFREMYFPYDNKLLPDWPTAPCYGNPPPGTPAPPLLVVDLEKTLIGSEYDARYGWRHVKRPGLDQFLAKLSSYYEIVIFSENDIGAVADVLFAIDPEGRCHKLGSAAAEARDGMMIKRLDYMNRDLDRIILIDDSPEAFQLFPRNTLQVKPFDDVKDSNDRVLFDLVPLLQAFVHDDAKDFRDTLDDLGTHEAEEAVVEWQMRVSDKKSEEQRKRNRGLGGIVRSRFAPGPASDRSSGGDGEERLISLSSLVGGIDDSLSGAQPAPVHANKSDLKGYGGIALAPGMDHSSLQAQKGPVKKRQGAFFEWLENTEKDKEEHEMRKREKMNEIYAKRMREKSEKDEKARQKERGGL